MTKNQQTQSKNANQKISTYLTMIVLIVMALGVTALLIAGETYLAGDQLAAAVLAGIGLIALVLSGFLLYQSKLTGDQDEGHIDILFYHSSGRFLMLQVRQEDY